MVLQAEQPASGFRGLASGFFQGSVNIAERLTGRDLDGDGDVGLAGHYNRVRSRRAAGWPSGAACAKRGSIGQMQTPAELLPVRNEA